jgi:hypothetical protein
VRCTAVHAVEGSGFVLWVQGSVEWWLHCTVLTAKDMSRLKGQTVRCAVLMSIILLRTGTAAE